MSSAGSLNLIVEITRYVIMKKILIFLFLFPLTYVNGYCGHVDTLQIYSPAMHKEVPCVVIVPDRYIKTSTQYPVLYLLHGYSGNYLDWVTRVPKLTDYVDEYNMIVVCPDGGYDSWYFDSPIDSSVRYESFMTKILVPTIDSIYRTMPNRQHRAICGLSMGGHGAMYLALRHPNLYGAVASISGGVDIRPFPNNWNIKEVLGDFETHKENWEKNTVINLVDKLKSGTLRIALDIGTSDFFLKVNRALHKKLLRLGIKHDYKERPGGHSWDYWRNAIAYEMLFFRKYFY